jgi:Xaa-Pro aminopeptidase
LKSLRAGVTVRDIALEVDYQFRKAGAEGNSFRSTVVIGGPEPLRNGELKRLEPGDSVMFDIGCYADGYCCDFGRSAFFGDPTREYLQLHETNLRAQRAGMAALRAGEITCGEIVPIVQDIMLEYPGVSNLIPQVGHAIGMTVHEPPFFIVGDKTVVQPGMTFTIEPTLRIPEKFCNRVEDIVLVTDRGAEYITQYPRDLYIIQ